MGCTHIITNGRTSGTEKIGDIVQYVAAGTAFAPIKYYGSKSGGFTYIFPLP